MRAYYYIPAEYQAVLKPNFDAWDGWLVLTGHYGVEREPFSTERCDCHGITPDGQHQYIYEGYIDELGNRFSLEGYILEGDLELYNPELHNALTEMAGVVWDYSGELFMSKLELK